jgi:hypothetical protein
VITLREGRIVASVDAVIPSTKKDTTVGTDAKITVLVQSLDTEGQETSGTASTDNTNLKQHTSIKPTEPDINEVVDQSRQRGDFSVYAYYVQSSGYRAVAVFAVFLTL